jgi:hypothetical protein
MAHKKDIRVYAPKGKQSEADRLSAIARAYRKDADGKDISSTGGAVTAIGQSPAVIDACLEAAADSC